MRKRRVSPAKQGPRRRRKFTDPPEDIFDDAEREVEIGCADDKAESKP